LVISLDDALAILRNWKDESTNILVVPESPFRQTLRGIEGLGVRWAMGQHGRVSQVLSSVEERTSKGIVNSRGTPGIFCRSPLVTVGLCMETLGKLRPRTELKPRLRLCQHFLFSLQMKKASTSMSCERLLDPGRR
jgi:hypothetical protein